MAGIDAKLCEFGYSLVRENITKWSGGVLFNGPNYSTLHIWHVYGEWHYLIKDMNGERISVPKNLIWPIRYRMALMKLRHKTGTREEFDIIWKNIANY